MKFYVIKEIPTCFTMKTIGATISQLKSKFGEPMCHDDEVKEKVQNEWYIGCETDEGEKYEFSVYDWKEYRIIDENEKIMFHIGSDRVFIPEEVITALLVYLNS